MVADHRGETPDPGGSLAGQHGPVSRRAMLRTAAGAGAAGLMAGSALAALPAVAAARPDGPGRPAQPPAAPGSAAMTAGAPADPVSAADGPLVIHVRDTRTGEMDIFAGTTLTRLRDPALAARLARASQ